MTLHRPNIIIRKVDPGHDDYTELHGGYEYVCVADVDARGAVVPGSDQQCWHPANHSIEVEGESFFDWAGHAACPDPAHILDAVRKLTEDLDIEFGETEAQGTVIVGRRFKGSDRPLDHEGAPVYPDYHNEDRAERFGSAY